MTLWWPSLASPYCFPDQPWGEWFWAIRPGSDLDPFHPSEWPKGYYWFYKILPSGSHNEQLAFRSPEDRKCPDYDRWGFEAKKDVIYVVTYPGDTPNFGGSSDVVKIAQPCANWNSALYTVPYVTRSQTWRMQAAVQSDLGLEVDVESAVAKTDYLELEVEAAVQGNPYLELDIGAAVQGDVDLTVMARAAIRAERELYPEVEAAVAHDFELYPEVEAAVQGNPFVTVRAQAAILGEAELTVNVVALVLKDRTDAIILEFENNWPQSFAQESVPNWPSKARHWGRDPLV